MRSFWFALALGLLGTAYAGTRFVQTTGSLPTKSTDGVPLVGMQVCRGFTINTDGGSVGGGSLVPYYYDSALAKWIQGADSSKCALDTSTQVDGGTRVAQICEWKVQAQYGRTALVPAGLTPQSIDVIRLECWGPDLPLSDGGAQ